MAKRQATNLDGRIWEIATTRFKAPSWHQSDYDPGTDDAVFSVLNHVVVAPFLWFVLPAARGLIEWPVALARAPFSSTRWIEVRCSWPSENTMTWRTSSDHAERVADELASRLQVGYDDLTPADATFVSMTQPPGLGDC